MRAAGIILMAGAVAGIGFWEADRLRVRLDALLLLRQMIYHLKNRILQGNDSLSEAFLKIGGRFSESRGVYGRYPGLFFYRVGVEMEQKKECLFSDIWKNEVDDLSKNMQISVSDQDDLKSFGEQLGYADRQMQERVLMFYLEQLEESIAGLKTEVAVQGKLYRSLGIASGIFVAILLI